VSKITLGGARGGSEKQIGKKTVHRVKVSSNWVQNETQNCKVGDLFDDICPYFPASFFRLFFNKFFNGFWDIFLYIVHDLLELIIGKVVRESLLVYLKVWLVQFVALESLNIFGSDLYIYII
jgi:hypothetical protein